MNTKPELKIVFSELFSLTPTYLLVLNLFCFWSWSQEALKPTFTVANIPGTTSSAPSTVPTTSTTMQVSSGPSFPITNYMAPASASSNVSANGTVLKTAPAGVMQLPSGFTFMPGRWGVTPVVGRPPEILLALSVYTGFLLLGFLGSHACCSPSLPLIATWGQG